MTYTEPEVATVGLTVGEAAQKGVEVERYYTSLEHNDRCILEGEDNEGGYVAILCAKGTDTVVGATIVAARAGEMVNEVTLAIKDGVGLGVIGRVIHAYPTSGEAVMCCGLAYIRTQWAKLK